MYGVIIIKKYPYITTFFPKKTKNKNISGILDVCSGPCPASHMQLSENNHGTED